MSGLSLPPSNATQRGTIFQYRHECFKVFFILVVIRSHTTQLTQNGLTTLQSCSGNVITLTKRSGNIVRALCVGWVPCCEKYAGKCEGKAFQLSFKRPFLCPCLTTLDSLEDDSQTAQRRCFPIRKYQRSLFLYFFVSCSTLKLSCTK